MKKSAHQTWKESKEQNLSKEEFKQLLLKEKIIMKTIKKVEIEPVFVEFVPKIIEENKLYISEEYNSAVHNCLCGCGLLTVTPLGGGKNWDLVKHSDGKVSLIGSVGNYNFPCKSHYIITRNIANFC